MAENGRSAKGQHERRRARKGSAEGHKRHRVKRSDVEDAEVKKLEAAIAEGMPAAGTNPLSLTADSTAGYAAARTFEELPISRYTLEALSANKFVTLTAIQRAALPHALAGRDILGAAKTGSGKTLAFLIPLVERLYRGRWARLDGLGGLVLTPTRELALQIFLELRKIGTGHDLSAGLLIGGKNVKEEQASINRMNVLVATPGRLLQHMDETPGFDASNLQVLVLDEADRLLDMGFAATLDAILSALPDTRQTMLFSATQTKSVKDLARLSLTDPEYLSVHEASDSATPLKLQQAVAVVNADQKMDVLWSFIKTHLAAKTIVFLSTCKQVRFFNEVFRKLRPGVPLRALHGGMKQMKRMTVFQDFCTAEHMVLFATDIAGRGLDFPSVDWVVQVDCPEDAAAYIHRVGRTARYLSAGRALMLLTPKESEGMKAALTAAKIPIKPIKINPAKQQSIGPALQALLSKTTQLKEWAQRALVAYVRSVFLAPAKDVFDVSSLPLEALAASWGLSAAPRMRFLKKVGGKRELVTQLGTDTAAEAGAVEEAGGPESGDDEHTTQKQQQQQQQPAHAKSQGKQQQQRTDQPDSDQLLGPGRDSKGVQDEEEEDFLVVKHRNVFGNGHIPEGLDVSALADGAGASAKKKRLKIKVGRATGQRVVFDQEGGALDPLAALGSDPHLLGQQGQGGAAVDTDRDGVHVVAEAPEERFSMAAQLMKQRDQQDKARLREQRALAKAERKARSRAADAMETGYVTLGRSQGEGNSGDDNDSADDDDGDDGAAMGADSDSGDEDMQDSGPGRGAEACGKRSRHEPLLAAKHSGRPSKRVATDTKQSEELSLEAAVLERIAAKRLAL